MKIKPSEKGLRAWAKLVPTEGDLLFFLDQAWSKVLPAPLLSVAQVREQGVAHWRLKDRSWYGYALNRAKFAAYLPRGMLETLPPALRSKLAREQMRLKVPTVLSAQSWISAQAFYEASASKRIKLLAAWIERNKIHFYESLSAKELGPTARRTLREHGMAKLLNRYAALSGPNCLAAAAAAAMKNPLVAEQWMHEAPFENFLHGLGYRPTQSIETGDVLVFRRGEKIVHAAFYLGDGVYFEKPGQDFYEPYRVAPLTTWKKEWPGAKMAALRKS